MRNAVNGSRQHDFLPDAKRPEKQTDPLYGSQVRVLPRELPSHSFPVVDPEIAQGTCFPMFAYEVAQAIDLDEAERRLFAGTERQTIKQKRRAPASFEYRPAPLRVTRGGEPQSVDGYRTAPTVEIVLYDFGAVSEEHRSELQSLAYLVCRLL